MNQTIDCCQNNVKLHQIFPLNLRINTIIIKITQNTKHKTHELYEFSLPTSTDELYYYIFDTVLLKQTKAFGNINNIFNIDIQSHDMDWADQTYSQGIAQFSPKLICSFDKVNDLITVELANEVSIHLYDFNSIEDLVDQAPEEFI